MAARSRTKTFAALRHRRGRRRHFSRWSTSGRRTVFAAAAHRRLPQDKALQLARRYARDWPPRMTPDPASRSKTRHVMIDGDGNARVLDFGLAVWSKSLARMKCARHAATWRRNDRRNDRQSEAISIRWGGALRTLHRQAAFEAASLNDLINCGAAMRRRRRHFDVKDLDP